MKIAMLFPGYGSQFVGMGKELYDDSRIMQEYFEEASNCLNINFVKLCFASSDAEISRVDNALLSNFLVSSALCALLKEQGIKPDIVAGHDAGEYAAIYAAGGISFPDMLYMLQKYSNFYQDLLLSVPTKSFKVTGLDANQIELLVNQYNDVHEPAFISCYESDLEHIVSGHSSTMEKLHEKLLEAGAKKVIDLLFVDGLHSVLMKSVYDYIKMYSEKVDFKDLHVPLLSMIQANNIIGKDDVKLEMLEQMVNPVRWNNVVKKLTDYDVLIELGPGTLISDKLKKLYPEKIVIAVNKDSDVQLINQLLGTSDKQKNDSDSKDPQQNE